MNKPSAEAFAAKAPTYLGRTYDEMDCRDLINAMLDDVGVSAHYKGSNALWRDMAWRGTPEEAASTFGGVPVGALLFIVSHDGGEVSKGYHDGLGNASHVGVKTGTGKGAIHSSASRGGVFESDFCDKTVKNGGWNAVGLLKQLDYGCALPEEQPSASPVASTAAFATVTALRGSTVKMRQKPSKRCKLYWDVPVGAAIEICGPETKGWYPVRYGGRAGYMAAEFVRIGGEVTSADASANYAAEIYDLTYEQAETIRTQYPQARISEICG